MSLGSQPVDETETESLGRRKLLRLGGVAAASAAAAAVATAVNASPAGATTGTMHYGAVNDAGTDFTELKSTNSETLLVINKATEGNNAILAVSDIGTGVSGESNGGGVGGAFSAFGNGGIGVHATTNGDTGHAIRSDVQSDVNPDPSIDASTQGLGPVIRAEILNNASSSDAVVAVTPGSGNGLTAQSTGGGNGVYALNGTTTGIGGPAGVYGDSQDATGVFGTTINSIGVRGLHGGYSGLEALGGFANGFAGGVVGESTGTGVGVVGASPGGVGIDGLSTTGTAVKATTANGIALDVHGKAKFNRSGKVAISDTATSAVVSVPGGHVNAATLVLAVLQTNQGGIWVTSAVPNTPAGKVTINLNAAPGIGNTVTVAWFVIG